jgi:hypothetical protein
VNIDTTSVEVRSFPPCTVEKVMATASARKSGTLHGAGEAPARLEELSRDVLIGRHREAVASREAGQKKQKTVICPGWRFCEGGCGYAPRR